MFQVRSETQNAVENTLWFSENSKTLSMTDKENSCVSHIDTDYKYTYHW